MNEVILIGRLTKDVELRYTPVEGKAVASFILAVNRNYKNNEGKNDADFILIEIWGKQAENIAKYCSKGSQIAVQGSLRVENYLYQEEKRMVTKVRANTIKFLDSKNKDLDHPTFQPHFDNKGLNPYDFQAIDDDEIPF